MRQSTFISRGASWATFALVVLAVTGSAFGQGHAHTHGHVSLDVAVGEGSIMLRIHSPLDNFLGFERSPRTEAERGKVADMVARLKAADVLFRPDPAGQCTLSDVDLSSAVLGLGNRAGGGLDPSHAKERAAGSKGEESGHAEVEITVLFKCSSAGAARYVDTGLLEEFKRIRTIDAQIASPQGQFKRKLGPKSARLNWGR